jgi:GTP cyclohydrolase I
VKILKDVQSRFDERGIAIQKVGINDVHLPFFIKTKDSSFQSVLAKIKFTVDLPMEYKGTHMSRFLEILSEWSKKPIGSQEMNQILDEALVKLDAQSAYLKINFKYFIDKIAPISKRQSVLDLDCSFIANKSQGEHIEFTMAVNVPFTSLCPCSKEISKYGAHNQRGLMRVKVKFRNDQQSISIEDLAAVMEQQASCPIYPLLKREDEKYVTETAYENPKFVEDILRDLVIALRQIKGVAWFSIECENYESIHNHSAYASHVEFVEH